MRQGILAMALCTTFLAAGSASAAQYPGWSDTGWLWAGKRECCNLAIDLANEDSVGRCLDAGGRPRAFSGGQRRGSCSWQWSQDPSSGGTMYRCTSQASVFCR